MARKRFWTTETIQINSNAGTATIVSLTTTLRNRLDSGGTHNVMGYTLARVLGKGLVVNEASDTSAAIGGYALGIGVFPSLIDAVDMPDLAVHEGDWLWYTSALFKGAGTGLTPIEPENARNIDIDSKSMRQMERASDNVFLATKLTDTSVELTYLLAFSLLWLMPEG